MASDDERIGAILNDTYRIERLLGVGGMGSVYEAVHQRVPRRFAVKMLNPEILGNKEVFERFRREAEIASSLGNPNIVQVMDFNHAEDGSPYMVLELLEGEDLSKRIAERGRMTLEETDTLLEQVSQALEAAHAAGIVHRDLKPANIFLTRFGARDDFVKILDFGISKVLHSQGGGVTRTGTVFGTPNYMSPEQAEGRQGDIDHRTDIFAIGAILYECLTGRMAFQAPTLTGTIFQVCYGSPQPVRSFAAEVPASVEQVLNRAMAKARDQRFESAAALQSSFRSACKGDASPQATNPSAAPTVASDPPPGMNAVPSTTLASVASETLRPGRPRRVGAWAISAGTVGLGAVAAAWLMLRDNHRITPETTTDVPIPSVSPPPESRAAVPPALTPPPAPADLVEIRLRLEPSDARVELNGVSTTMNPLLLPRGKEHKLIISAPGYIQQERTIESLVDGEIDVKLAKQPVRKPTRKKRRSQRKAKSIDWEDW